MFGRRGQRAVFKTLFASFAMQKKGFAAMFTNKASSAKEATVVEGGGVVNEARSHSSKAVVKFILCNRCPREKK